MTSLAERLPQNTMVFAGAALAGLALAFGLHFALNQKEAEVLIIGSSRLDGTAAFAPIESESKANDTKTKIDIKTVTFWLHSFDFMDALFKKHCLPTGTRAYCSRLAAAGEKAPLVLLKLVDTRIEDGRVLRVRARGHDRDSAAQLAADLGHALVSMGTEQAKADAERIEKQLVEKRLEIENRVRSAIQALSKSGAKAGPTLYANPEKHFSFISDLQAKVFEIDLKLAESARAVAILREQGSAGDTEYGPELKIRRIQAETKLLQETKKSIERQIQDTVSQQAGGLSGGLTQLQDQLRTDMGTLSTVSKAIERIRLLASMHEAEIEILQQASPLLARDRWSLPLLLALGIFLSQLFTAAALVLLDIWRAQPARQAVVGKSYAPSTGAFYGPSAAGKARESTRDVPYRRPKADTAYTADLPN